MKTAAPSTRILLLLLLLIAIVMPGAAQGVLNEKDLKDQLKLTNKIEQLTLELQETEDKLFSAQQEEDTKTVKQEEKKIDELKKELEKTKRKLEKETERLEKLQAKRQKKEQETIEKAEKKRIKEEEKLLEETRIAEEKAAQLELERGIPIAPDSLHSQYRIIEDPNDPKTWQWNKNEATRFSIRGDFDGDGFYENLYEGARTLFSDNPEISLINLDGDLGVYYLANEGDLDGDGGDEISFMTVYRDFSNINTFRVYTYTGNIWKELIQVRGHEWDCPNFQPKTATERFTHEWKRKNQYKTDRIVLKQHNGIVDMINIGPSERYTIEHIKIINKKIAKRHWGEIIQPRFD